MNALERVMDTPRGGDGKHLGKAFRGGDLSHNGKAFICYVYVAEAFVDKEESSRCV